MSNVTQLEPRITAHRRRRTASASSPLEQPGKLLQSITFERLEQFATRRKQLGVLKGCAAVAILALSSLFVAVLIDGLIPQSTAQWVACGVFYVPVLVTLCIWVWRPWRKPLHWSQEAALFEQRDPTLRGNLLSALELSSEHTDLRTSLAFRRELQQQVANEIASSDVEAMLPFESVTPRLKLVGGIALLFSIFLVVPGVHGPLRVARVLAPFLDWGRTSHLRIEMLEPSSRSTSVALNDSLVVVAQLDREPTQSVELEIQQQDGSARKLELAPPAGIIRPGQTRPATDAAEDNPTLSTTLTATDAKTRFRVTSGNAATPWYTLNASERPAALSMRAQITLPDYAGSLTLPELDALEGDLRVLQGAKVNWSAEFNQPVSKANWLIQNKQDKRTEQVLAFALSQPGTAGVASLQADNSLAMRLDLKSQTSGLTNSLPTTQRLEIQPDSPPRIRWQSPTNPTLSKAAADIVDFSIVIEDELPLAKLTQVVRIFSSQNSTNRSSLKPDRELASELEHKSLHALSTPALEALAGGQPWREKSRRSLDLLPFNLRAGDRIEVVVRATDLRGQTQETTPLRINVSSIGLNLAQNDSEKARERIAQRLDDLTSSLPTPNELSEFSESERQGLAADLAKKFDGVLPILSADIKQTLEAVNNMGTTHEMLQLGLGLQDFQDALSSSNASAPTRRNLKNQLDQLQTLSRAAIAFSADDTARRHSKNLLGLATGFATLAGDSELTTDANARQQQILFRQTSQIAQDMLDSVETLPEPSQKSYLNTVARLETLSRQADTRLTTAIPTQQRADKELKAFAAGTANALRSLGGVANLHSWIPEQATRSLQQLSQSASSTSQQLMEHINSGEGTTHERLDHSARDLTERREIARASSRSTGEFSANLGLARRALEETSTIERTQPAERSTIRGRIEAIARALQVLEVTEQHKQAAAHLRDLLETERWKVSSPESATESPRVWDSYKILTSRNAQRAASSSLPPEIKDLLAKLSWNSSVAEAQDKILPRRWNATNFDGAAQPLESLLQQFEAAQIPLDVQAKAARQALEQLGPTLAELAKKAAAETRELSRQTLDAGNLASTSLDTTDKRKTPKKAEPTVAINQQAIKAEQAISRLRDALVDLGDSQDLLSMEQLETARLADEGIKVTDQASESVATSTELFEPTTEGKKSSLPANADVAEASAAQEMAAQNLEQLSSLMESQNSQSTPQDLADRAAKIASQLDEAQTSPDSSDRDSPSNDRFSKARQLAKIAAANAEELLRSLEAALLKNTAMQEELSDIAKALSEQALRDLESAANQQNAIRNRIENSDPAIRQQKQEVLDILTIAQREVQHVANLFLREAGTAAQLAKLPEAKSTFGELEQTVQNHLGNSPIGHHAEPTLSALLEELQRFSQTVAPIAEELNQESRELFEVSENPIHSNGSELNNRRRSMRNRANRVRSQDAKNLRQLVQQLKQRIQPVRDQFRLAQEQLQRAAEHSVQMRGEAERNSIPANRDRLLRAEQALALARKNVAAIEGRLQRSEQRMQAMTARGQAVEQANQELLESQNPSAELAARLANWSEVRLQEILAQVGPMERDENSAAATSDALNTAAAPQFTVQREVQSAANSLARASRHEGRLENERSQQELAAAATSAESTATNELAQVRQSIRDALSDSASETTSGQAPTQSTQRVMAAAEQGREAIEKAKSQLESILGHSESTPSTKPPASAAMPSPSSPQPLTPRQMAELLNELDDRLKETQLGAKEDDASSAPAGESKSSPSTLKKAAEQLAKSLSRSRSNPTNQSNSDLGMATDSELANVEPQGPTRVDFLDVTRVGADWGELPEQTTDNALQSDRRTLAPYLQRQVDAYFKNIGQEVGKQ
ncbi:MAG: hypothetical protein AB8B50_06400 [Pirellulaceae bacterium]